MKTNVRSSNLKHRRMTGFRRKKKRKHRKPRGRLKCNRR